MDRASAYRRAKELGYSGNVPYQRGTKQYWNEQVEILEELDRLVAELFTDDEELDRLVAELFEDDEEINQMVNDLFEEDIEDILDRMSTLDTTMFDDRVEQFIRSGDTLVIPGREVIGNIPFLISSIEKYMDNLSDNKMLIIKVDNIYYTFNKDTMDRLMDIYVRNEEYVLTGSDYELAEVLYQPSTDVELIIKDRNKKIKEGAFFKYIHLIDFSNCDDISGLREYGIFDEVDNSNYTENCLMRALRTDSNVLKTFVVDRNIPQKYLTKIGEELDLHIILKSGLGKTRVTHYNKKGKKSVKIGLLDDHYFRIEKTKLTSYAIKNYYKIKDTKNWNYLYKKGKRDKSRTIDSFKVISLLLKSTLLKRITASDGIDTTCFFDKNYEITNLEYGDSCRLVENHIKSNNLPKIWFDFETTTDNLHKPYLVCWADETNTFSALPGGTTEYNSTPAYKMLQSITKPTMLIAHNLSYDFRFLYKYLFNMKLIMKGTKIIMGTATYRNDRLNKNIKLSFKDSLFLIPMKLAAFGDAFDLDSRKEVMPYNLYTSESILEKNQLISDALKYLKKDEHEQFLKNLDEWNLRQGEYFDFIEYSRLYCELDCIVLRDGYNKFKLQMMEITGLDIDNIATLPSLADKFLIKKGCYDGVYEFSGIVRAFIQKCVVGGRVMTRNNKQYHVKEELNDLDAVSLYPSAMYRLDGFLCGKPKIINNFEEIKNKADGYFIEIKVKNMSKRPFPLVSSFDDNGIRQFSNDPPKNTIFVDNITLEDMEKFQNIEYEFVRGYYFDSGFNPKIKEVIKHLFNERLKKKAEGNKIQLLYKLLMNSSYGKTILKPIDTEIKFFNKEDIAFNYFARNYNQIKYLTYLGDTNKCMIKKIKPINKHYNRCHVGVQILSMSKRIMNEVMCLADDIKAKIYYQDTDSMHIQNNRIDELSNKFKQKYGRDMIGKSLGQFHCDFDFRSSEMPYSVESYFLGKKSYIDKVRVFNGKEEFKYHIRMKGIPTKCITDLNDNPMETYKKLYEGNVLEVDLVKGGKLMFDFKPNFDITTRSEFQRIMYFGSDRDVLKKYKTIKNINKEKIY